MDYRKKLKARLYTAICCISSGIIFIALFYSKITGNQYLFTLGIALVITGILRIIQYKRITKDDESIRRQMVAETDERNITILNKAKGIAFGLYLFITCTAVIILEVVDKTEYSTILALNVCALTILYWISYWIYQKKT